MACALTVKNFQVSSGVVALFSPASSSEHLRCREKNQTMLVGLYLSHFLLFFELVPRTPFLLSNISRLKLECFYIKLFFFFLFMILIKSVAAF